MKGLFTSDGVTIASLWAFWDRRVSWLHIQEFAFRQETTDNKILNQQEKKKQFDEKCEKIKKNFLQKCALKSVNDFLLRDIGKEQNDK